MTHRFSTDSGHRVLQGLVEPIAKAAQAIYDAWEQDEEGMSDDYGAGGICDDVASAIVLVLDARGIEATSVHDDSENHTYAMAKFPDGIYSVDIPYAVYETGSFYRYSKRPDAEIEASDVVWDRVFPAEEADARWADITRGF